MRPMSHIIVFFKDFRSFESGKISQNTPGHFWMHKSVLKVPKFLLFGKVSQKIQKCRGEGGSDLFWKKFKLRLDFFGKQSTKCLS